MASHSLRGGKIDVSTWETSSPYAARPWFAHYPEQVPHSIDYPDKTLHGLLQEAAEKWPDNTATIYFGKRMSYKELWDQSRRLAAGLASLGVTKGTRVSIMLANSPPSVIAFFAVLMLGGIVVNTNPLYMERELEHQLADSGATHIICLDLVYPRVAKVEANTNLKHIIVTKLNDYMPVPIKWLYPIKAKKDGMAVTVPQRPNVHRFLDLVKHAPFTGSVDVDAREDTALLQYTGATTGRAKGCILTHYNLVSNVIQGQHWIYKLPPGQGAVLVGLPLFHVYGMTVAMNFAVASGAAMILQPRFNPPEAVKLIEKYKPTIFPGAPTMYVGINNLPGVENRNLSSVEVCLSGAAALPQEVQDTFERLSGGRLVEGYGLTEASPVTHANPIWDRRKLGSIGLPWPDTDCRIVDPETMQDMPVGEIGELAVRGPQVMKGYWNNPEATAATLRDGWLLTGDMARMDEEGYFYIVDRKKDMIIAGGFNIYPREVEEVLFEHPAILEASVVGVPDEYRGETVKAFVVLKPGKSATAEEIIAYCREKIAAYKVPRQIEFRQELPKTLVGKVLRRVLAEEEAAKVGSGGGDGSAGGGDSGGSTTEEA